MGIVWLILVALAVVAAWRMSVRLYPWRTCPRCKGGRVYGGGGHRDCGRCGATGRVRRLGARRG